MYLWIVEQLTETIRKLSFPDVISIRFILMHSYFDIRITLQNLATLKLIFKYNSTNDYIFYINEIDMIK